MTTKIFRPSKRKAMPKPVKAATTAKAPPEKRVKAMSRFIEEVDRFADILRENQEEIVVLEEALALAKQQHDDAKADVREAHEIEHTTVRLLLKFIVPGSCEILPLFDKMEPSDEKKHGEHSTEWRKEPIVAMALSAAAMRALIDADIVMVGQLQDRMLASPEAWFESLGISTGMAEAIAEKLHEFMAEKSK